MEKIEFTKFASILAGAAIFGAVSVTAQAATTAGHSDQAIAVQVPAQLCSVEAPYLADLSRKIQARSDFSTLYEHMLRNCPELALKLEVPTAAISTPTGRGPEDNASKVPEAPTRETRSPETPSKEEPKDEKPSNEEPEREGPGDGEPRDNGPH